MSKVPIQFFGYGIPEVAHRIKNALDQGIHAKELTLEEHTCEDNVAEILTYTTKRGRTIEVIVRYADGKPPEPIAEGTATFNPLDLIDPDSN